MSTTSVFRILPILGLAASPAFAAKSERPQPTLKYESVYAGNTQLEANSVNVGEVAVTRHIASLNVPLKQLSSSTFPSFGLEYSGFYLDKSGDVPLSDELQSLSASLGVLQKLNERWTLISSVSPGLHNAGSSFSTKGFGFGVFALANYKVSETLTLGAGFVYDSLSESIPLMPIVGARWNFANGWEFTLAFPSTRVTYAASSKLKLRASLDLDVGSFHVENDPGTGAASQPSLRDTVLDYTAISTGIGADYVLTDDLTLSATLGYNFSRTANYDERDYEIEAKDGAPTARLGLTYTF